MSPAWHLGVLGGTQLCCPNNFTTTVLKAVIYKCFTGSSRSPARPQPVVLQWPLGINVTWSLIHQVFVTAETFGLLSWLCPLLASLSSEDSLCFKDAYLHVSIHPSYWRYLRFALRNADGDIVVFYQWKVLPFVLATAPKVFKPLLDPAADHLHLQDVSCVLA